MIATTKKIRVRKKRVTGVGAHEPILDKVDKDFNDLKELAMENKSGGIEFLAEEIASIKTMRWEHI